VITGVPCENIDKYERDVDDLSISSSSNADANPDAMSASSGTGESLFYIDDVFIYVYNCVHMHFVKVICWSACMSSWGLHTLV
jgi:hypothetical protein